MEKGMLWLYLCGVGDEKLKRGLSFTVHNFTEATCIANTFFILSSL